jgi:FtsH-binding integral membrane protein
MRKGGGISIWFFVGVSLLVNGGLILGAGVWEWFNPPANPVVLFRLHASVWWGAVLLLLGILYSLKFSPNRVSS